MTRKDICDRITSTYKKPMEGGGPMKKILNECLRGEKHKWASKQYIEVITWNVVQYSWVFLRVSFIFSSLLDE